MGVGDDFARFKAAYNLSHDKMESISYRYKRITRQLNTDFRSTSSDTANSLYVGSYGRDTAATGVSDIDMAYILPLYLFDQYGSYAGNGQSALLQSIKRSIQNTYSTSEVSGDGQVVVINFQDKITFEVLPVFNHEDGQSFVFPNANNGGSWRVCNPRGEMAAVQVRSDATNRNLKYIARMMRIWRDYCKVPISGLLIDTLAYQFIDNYAYRDKSFWYHDWMARDFFDYLSKQDKGQQHWRAPGSGAYVWRSGIFEHKARRAYLRAVEAIEYDARDHVWSRRQKWREVFGSFYPA